MRIIEIQSYEVLSGLIYDVAVPSEFTFMWSREGDRDELSKDFPDILNRQPSDIPNVQGTLFSISDHAGLVQIEEADGVIIVRVEGNAGQGSWRDAVFSLRKYGDGQWKAKLLLAGKGHCSRRENPRNCHSKYMLTSVSDGVLHYTRQWFDYQGKPMEESFKISF